ncbi:MAG TPA: biotin--[acetyl-CoA-carboxylase] ligase [Abditibacterium sp.]|jgi:BirA family biotin operon repressor/biotin-[acetyl-CoA-carboxylase] ligase
MLGEPILRLDETDSTNRVALDWADAPGGACVVARSQTRGRGRLGRSWSSPANAGLYLSLVWRPESGENLAHFSLATALGVALALEKLAPDAQFRLKWPNDVLCLTKHGEARKIGGILCEAKGGRIVLGIGLNVRHEAAELPDRPLFPASSLRLETGRDFEIEAVLQATLRELDGVLSANFADWRLEWMRRCYGLGELVRVQTESQTETGIFDGIGDDGALLLRTAGGLKSVFAGDVAYPA